MGKLLMGNEGREIVIGKIVNGKWGMGDGEKGGW